MPPRVHKVMSSKVAMCLGGQWRLVLSEATTCPACDAYAGRGLCLLKVATCPAW